MSQEPAPAAPPEVPLGLWGSTKEALTLVVSFAGIFIGMMIFMGAAYMRGFTLAVGLVPDQLKIDSSTYMLFGVQHFGTTLILCAILVLLICAAFIVPTIIMSLIPWRRFGFHHVLPLIAFFAIVIKTLFTRNTNNDQEFIPAFLRRPLVILVVWAFSLYIGVISLFWVLDLGMDQAEAVGMRIGRQTVAASSLTVTVMSKEPLILSTAISPTTTISNVLVYANLSLITYNEQRYFVFRDINPATCRPREVFAIAEGATLGVQVTTRSVPLTGTVALPAGCQ